MQKRNTNLIVGIVILLSLAILIGGIRFLSEAKFSENTYILYAYFDNIGTLTIGDPIKINGVKRGKVKDIQLEKQRVKVTMAIKKEVTITDDSKIVIQNIGLMGERMIGIHLGNGTPLKKGGSMNGNFDSGIAEAMGMLGEVLAQVQITIGELQGIIHQTVGADEFLTSFNKIISRLDKTTATLDRLIVQNQDALQGSINDLSVTAKNVRSFFDSNKERLDKSVENVEEITEQTKALLTKADKISTDIEEIVGRINSNESSVGRLLNDTLFVENVKATLVSADSLLQKIQKKGLKVGFW